MLRRFTRECQPLIIQIIFNRELTIQVKFCSIKIYLKQIFLKGNVLTETRLYHLKLINDYIFQPLKVQEAAQGKAVTLSMTSTVHGTGPVARVETGELT